ncbi:MAG TPA: LuxR C-terminal-related transcriptional regulator, partial [Microbacterium sp.]|nr:LuxR C-terminal-related transcriptional regulator [Microbacterium sp.]
ALRRLEAEPVLVILSLRSDAPTFPDDAMRRFLAEPRIGVCALDGLSLDEIVDLADRMGAGLVDGVTAARLHEHTGGLPLHTVALLAERGADRLKDAGRVLPAPRSLIGIVHDRMDSMTPAAREVLSAGAVLGTTFPAAVAGQLAQVADPTVPLREAAQTGLIEPASETAIFRHRLIRAAVYGDLTPARRRALHAAAAAATSGVESLMHRVDAADDVDDALAGDLATAALESDGAVRADLLLAAARRSSDAARRDAHTVAAAGVLLQHGLSARAHALRPMLDAAAATTGRDVVLALLDIDEGRFAAARERAATALAAPDPDPVAVAHAHAALALARWSEGDFAGAVDEAAEALRGDVGALTARCCYLHIVALEVLGRIDELPPDHLPAGLSTTDRLALDGITRYHRNDISGAIASLDAAVRRGRAGHPTSLFILVLGILADALFRAGRWDDAALHAELAVSLARDTDAYGEQLLAHAAAAEIQSARGRLEATAEHLDGVRRFAAAMPTWPTLTRLGMTEALVAIAIDDHDGLLAAERTLTAEPGRTHVTQRPAAPWHALVAEAQLVSGRVDEASRSVDALRAGARLASQRQWAPDLARLTGWLAEVEGRFDDALAAYRIRDADAAAAHNPLAVARLTFARGLLQVRQGDTASGRAALIEARAAFAKLGAEPFLQRCEQAMDAADRASLAAMPMLSPRQEAVALLVADRMTNREIARRLYVSVKTVEYHLGQIYARTGLSRRELGARVRASPTWSARTHIPG